MTETRTTVEIACDPFTIFRLAAETERWPEFLAHYRWVRILDDRGAVRVVEMAARRGWIPIRWVAEQRNDPARPHIAFHHVRGWTRGMDVEWLFEPTGHGTRVTIVHRLQFKFPIFAGWLGKHVVSEFFIDYVARRTLARIKEVVEKES